MNAFLKIRKTELMASFQWTSTQVLLRTLWTKVKEFKARPLAQNANDRCVNCGQAAEHIVHIMFECPLMQGVLQKISSMISREEDTNVDLTCDAVLFHVKPEVISDEKQRDLTDILLIVKHVVYRVRFRENVTAFPTVKAIIIDIIIELERFNRICESDLTEYILDLRHQINWS